MNRFLNDEKDVSWFSSYEALKWVHTENNGSVPKLEHHFERFDMKEQLTCWKLIKTNCWMW